MRPAGCDHLAGQRENLGKADTVERHAKDGDRRASGLVGWSGGLHETC
jgi:hypothetical protein